MSDDWQVGDLALCVDDSPHPDFGHPIDFYNIELLREGRTYRVSAVVHGCLRLDGVPLNDWGGHVDGYKPERFRKIRPDAHEDCEPEFVTLLKRIKRKVTA